MFEKLMMPLDRQYDDGYEVIGDAFKEAAERLAEESEGRMIILHVHLPIGYLYRHAIELYLKSSIITIHRALRLPTGNGAHTRDPQVNVDGKWKSIHRTHSLQSLLSELTRLLTDHKSVLTGNWDTPQELADWIDTIVKSDELSTYFRYPSSKGSGVDSEKSGFLPTDQATLIAEMNSPSESQKGKIVVVLNDDDDNVVEVFSLRDNPLPELRDALVGAAQMLSGYAFGLYAELVCGHGRQGGHEPAM